MDENNNQGYPENLNNDMQTPYNQPDAPQQGADYNANAGYNAGADYNANAGYNAGADYNANAGYNAGADYNANAGYNAGADYNANAGYNAGADYNANAGYNAGAGYDSQNMNGYSNPDMNGYSQNGMNAFGDQTPYQAPTPKKKKGGKIALFSLIGVVAVAAIITAVYFLVRKTPEEVVKSSMKNTLTESAENSVLEEATGVSEFSDDKMDFDMSLTINDIHEMDGIEGATFAADGAFEKDGNLNLNGSITIADETLSTSIYCIDRVIYYELPELYDDVFKMDLGAMMDAVDTSELDTETQNEVKELYNQYMEPAAEELKNAVTYEKVGKAEVDDYNGNAVKCKQYTVTLTTAAVKDYVTALSNYLNEYATTYITDEQMEELGLSRDEFAQVMTYLPSYYGMVFSRDFVLNVYVKNKNVVKITMDYRFAALGAEVSLAADYMGEDEPASDMAIVATVSAEGETQGTFTFTKKTEDSKSEKTTKMVCNVVARDETVASIEKNDTFTKSSNAFSSNMTISSTDGPVLAYELAGSLQNVEKGKSFGIAVDTFKLTDGTTVYVDVSGEVRFGDLGAEIKQPDASKNVIDYSEMTDEYMSQNINEENLNRIGDAWGKVFGESIPSDDGELDLDDFTSSSDVTDVTGDEDEEVEVDSSNLDDTDYSGITMKSDKYTIAIKDPAGYERGYADTSEIDIFNDKYNAYYMLTEDCDKEKECEDFISYFEYLGDDCKLIDKKMEQVTGSDGKTMDCYVVNSEIYNMKVVDYYYFYPLNDNDYIIANVNIWAEAEGEEVEADMTAVADELVNANIINVQ